MRSVIVCALRLSRNFVGKCNPEFVFLCDLAYVDATNAIKANFPDYYLYDPTPIWKATLRVACNCMAVESQGSYWVFNKTPAKAHSS